MDFFTLIERRRSVRAFQGRPIEEEKVRRLLRAAQRAPSAGNLQAVEVFATTRPEVKQALAQAAWDQMFIAQAPLVLETLVMFSGVDLPAKAIRQQIASAVDLIIQTSRLRDGSRKVIAVTEVSGMEGDIVTLTDIFRFEQTGLDTDGKVLGELKPTGIRPLFMPRLEAAGFKLPPQVFGFGDVSLRGKRRR